MNPRCDIVERHLQSKSGRPDECEDALYAEGNFVAAIDGATAKSTRRWGGETRGRSAAELLQRALATLRTDVDAFEAIQWFTDTIQDTYRSFGAEILARDQPVERITACIAMLSVSRREIWLVGDCQARVGSRWIRNNKHIDSLIAGARAAFLELALANGMDADELRSTDPGRAYILPLLEQQAVLQNNPSAGPLWYPVLDGFPVPREGIRIIEIPDDVYSVVLATDGYPILSDTLAESEAELARVLTVDPLLIREFSSTKTAPSSEQSFDDRAYIRVHLGPV